MLPYYTFNKPDLLSFATNRKLQVRSTAKNSNEPTRGDLIQALKHADTVRTFNFLDLPPELRTNIYTELLVLKNSFTCHPQILQTCKLINDEASNILYGNNLIEVKVYADGVYVHGVRAGTYNTDYIRSPYAFNSNPILQVIEWPQFIHKAQFMRFTVMRYVNQYPRLRRVPPRSGPMYFILHSFCSFLRTKNRLRSLEVDLSELQTLFASFNMSQQYRESISTVLYPLRLLPKMKRLRVEGISDELTSPLMPSKSAVEVANKIASGATYDLHEQMKLAKLTRAELYPADEASWHPDAVRMAESLKEFVTMSIFSSKMLLKGFLEAVESVRKAWDMRMDDQLSGECKKRIRDLVQLEVELELAMDQSEKAYVVEIGPHGGA